MPEVSIYASVINCCLRQRVHFWLRLWLWLSQPRPMDLARVFAGSENDFNPYVLLEKT